MRGQKTWKKTGFGLANIGLILYEDYICPSFDFIILQEFPNIAFLKMIDEEV